MIDRARFPALAASLGRQRRSSWSLGLFFAVTGIGLVALGFVARGRRGPDLRFVLGGVASLCLAAVAILSLRRTAAALEGGAREIVWIYEDSIAGGPLSQSVIKLCTSHGAVLLVPDAPGFTNRQILAELTRLCPHAVFGMTDDRKKRWKEAPGRFLSTDPGVGR